MVAIRIERLRKSYGAVDVLHDVDLSISEGEFVVLVGPSGCGKSTLLRCVAGLNRIDGGDILFDGRSVAALPPQERRLSMVFQNYALYPHLTVADNLAFGLKVQGVAKDEIQRRIAWAAELLSIQPYLQRRPRALSGGQRQRVAMGRAVVKQSGAFLFDEPLSNLDAKLRVQMRKDIRALQRKLNVTSVYVTHDQIEAMTMGDRIVVMNAGRIEQVGAPMELYENPKSIFVAGFIGSPPMNFVPGEAFGSKVRLSDGSELRIAAEARGPVTLGIRPENFSGRDGDDNRLDLPIRFSQQLGNTTSYFLDLAGTEVEVQEAGISAFTGRMQLRLSPGSILVFGEDGMRIGPQGA